MPRAPGEFILRHYAGEVTYWTAGFVRKNREALPDSLTALLGLSSLPLASQLGAPSPPAAAVPHSPAAAADADGDAEKAAWHALRLERLARLSGTPGALSPATPAATAMPGTPGGGGGTPGGGSGGGGGTPARLTGSRPARPGAAGRGAGGAGSRASAFKQQLSGLVRSMAATRCHYVRCVNPRAAAASALQGQPPPRHDAEHAAWHALRLERHARLAGSPASSRGVAAVATAEEMQAAELAAAAAGLELEFDASRVLAQLQALGTLQAVQMARHGYPDL